MNNQRGSALWESLPVSALMLILVAAILAAGYLLFARSWVLYQSEQALYCVAERQPSAHCASKMRGQVQRFLPWGELRIVSLIRANAGGEVRARWTLQSRWSAPFRITVNRKLDLSLSKRSRLSRW